MPLRGGDINGVCPLTAGEPNASSDGCVECVGSNDESANTIYAENCGDEAGVGAMTGPLVGDDEGNRPAFVGDIAGPVPPPTALPTPDPELDAAAAADPLPLE